MSTTRLFIGARSVALAGLLLLPACQSILARPPKSGPAQKASPMIVSAHGNMKGNVVAVTSEDGKALFDLELTGAKVDGDTIELSGSVGTPSVPVVASVAGTLAKEPGPDYKAARARRAAAQRGTTPSATEAEKAKTPDSPGAIDPAQDEKDRAALLASGVTGCEVMFLRMPVPPSYVKAVGAKTVQINVALAKIDNASGVQISKRICDVVFAIDSGVDPRDEVAALAAELGKAK